ncbi:MAG: hypothetical protein IJW62_08125 [Clostridia bacterium]|nr:hypothetical protein [Clostridia bacterium]
MNNYQSIIKQTAKDVLGNMGLYSNSSKRIWYDDNGFYLTIMEIAPCNVGGIFVNIGICPLWKKSLALVNYDIPSGRLTSPEVPNFKEALLYCLVDQDEVNLDIALQPEVFEYYFRKLMALAKRQFEVGFKQLTDLNYFAQKLENRKDSGCRQRDGHAIDLDHAIVAMTAGDVEKGKALMEYAIAHSIRPKEVIKAEEMLVHTNSREEWLDYINRQIAEGRDLMSKQLKFLTKKSFRFE